MSSHLINLIALIPDLLRLRILDLGSGRGNFLIELASLNCDVVGIEKFEDYVIEARAKATSAGQDIDMRVGSGENLPFLEATFDFVNLSEVIEHVVSPEDVMAEVYRVLRPGGVAYLSIPNRLGFFDQHYHIYFINWMPRLWADRILNLLKLNKDQSRNNGEQLLSKMHYYYYSSIKKILKTQGFIVLDIRDKKLRDKFGKFYFLFQPFYVFARTFYLDSFHLLLKK